MMGEWIGRIERKFQDVLNKMLLTSTSLTAIEGYIDGLEALIGTTNSSLTTLNAKDFATQTTLAALNSKDFATQTTLAALLAELQLKADLTETQPVSVSGVSTAANQATEIAELQTLTNIVSTTIAQLDAPGTSTSIAVPGKGNGTFAYTIATIDTSVTVSLEGSVNGSNWFTLVSGVTSTSNGTYFHSWSTPVSNVRINFSAEVGGTNATIDGHVYAIK